MILSTKLLRRINPDAGVICCNCDKPATYYDAAVTTGPVGYCGAHAFLEDLDPDDALNSKMLFGCAASRTAAFPECMDIADLFTATPRLPAGQRAPTQLWAKFAPHDIPQGLDNLIALPHVAEWIRENSIYSSDQKLDTNHYIDLHPRQVDGRLLVYIFLKFQQIIGTRLLAVVPEETVEALLGDKK